MLVLIPAAGFNSQGCAGFNSGLLELKPAQPQGESPAFPGRVPASPHGRRRYPGLPTASAVGTAESETVTLPRACEGASLMRLLWSLAGADPAPRCREAIPVSQLETAPWTAENGPRGSRTSRKQAAAGRGPRPTEDQHAKGWEPAMNRHSRPHSSRSTPQTSSELWGMGGGRCNMQAQTQHMARVPSRFDSYLEARSGLARDACATTFHPTRRSSRCC